MTLEARYTLDRFALQLNSSVTTFPFVRIVRDERRSTAYTTNERRG